MCGEKKCFLSTAGQINNKKWSFIYLLGLFIRIRRNYFNTTDGIFSRNRRLQENMESRQNLFLVHPHYCNCPPLFPSNPVSSRSTVPRGPPRLKLWFLSTNHRQMKKLKMVTVFFSFAHHLKCICGEKNDFFRPLDKKTFKNSLFYL